MMMMIKMMLLLSLVSVASVSWSASHFLLNKAAAQEHLEAEKKSVTPSSDQQPPDKTNGDGDQTQQKQTQRRKL